MDLHTLYHGSDEVVNNPRFGVGKADNDYGSGFYTTEDPESAKEWAVINGQAGKGVSNQYELDFEGLNVLYLDDFGTLAWIAEVISNRGTDNALNAEIGDLLVSKFKVDTSKADVIVGYRADDSYIKVVDAFLEGKLTIDEVDRMFRKGQLGKQVFIKSPEAFAKIKFIDFENVKEEQGYGDRDRIARREVSTFLKSRERAIQIDGLDVSTKGLTVRDAIKGHLEYKDGYYQHGGSAKNHKRGGTDYDPD